MSWQKENKELSFFSRIQLQRAGIAKENHINDHIKRLKTDFIRVSQKLKSKESIEYNDFRGTPWQIFVILFAEEYGSGSETMDWMVRKAKIEGPFELYEFLYKEFLFMNIQRFEQGDTAWHKLDEPMKFLWPLNKFKKIWY